MEREKKGAAKMSFADTIAKELLKYIIYETLQK